MKRFLRKGNSARGFTVIELMIYTAVFTLVMLGFVTFLVTVTSVQTKQFASAEVEQQSQFVLQQLQYYISSASYIDIPMDTPTSTIILRTQASSTDPTVITLSGGTIFIQQGSSAQTALTSNKVTATNLQFTRRGNPPGHDSVGIGLTLTYNGGIANSFTQAFQTSVARVSAANFDSSIIPSSTNLTLGNGVNIWSSINGQIYFSGANVGVGAPAPGEVLEVNGGLRLNTAATRPTCNSAHRGDIWVTESASLVTDNISVCLKSATDTYNWILIVTGG